MEEDQLIKLIFLIKKEDCHEAYINLMSYMIFIYSQ